MKFSTTRFQMLFNKKSKKEFLFEVGIKERINTLRKKSKEDLSFTNAEMEFLKEIEYRHVDNRDRNVFIRAIQGITLGPLKSFCRRLVEPKKSDLAYQQLENATWALLLLNCEKENRKIRFLESIEAKLNAKEELSIEEKECIGLSA